eukprot:85153-Chlamydomonas_euryale.AAC.1
MVWNKVTHGRAVQHARLPGMRQVTIYDEDVACRDVDASWHEGPHDAEKLLVGHVCGVCV